MPSSLAKAKEYLKYFDQHGHPVTLHYQQRTHFKTTFGGLASICANVIIILYLIVICSRLTDNQYNINKVQFNKNVVQTPGNLKLTTKDLQMGIRPKFIGKAQENLDIRRFYRVSFGPEYFEWQGAKIEVSFEDQEGVSCSRQYFGLSEREAEKYGLKSAYCPPEKTFKISGQWSNETPFYYKALVQSCRVFYETKVEQDKNCESEAEIQRLTHQVVVDFFLMNKYFDPNEFNANPVKSYFKYFYIPLIPDQGHSKVFTTKYNKIIAQNSPFAIFGDKPQEYSFFTFDLQQQYQQSLKTESYNRKQWLFAVWFVEDEERHETERVVFQLIDVVAELGGFINIITVIAAIVCYMVARFLYETSIAQKIYLLNKDYWERDTENKKIVSEMDMKSSVLEQQNEIKKSIKSRVPFEYTCRDLWGFLLSRFCCCCKEQKQKYQLKFKYFMDAHYKLEKEMDIVQLMKRMRKFQILKQVTLKKHQRKLIRYFRKSVVNDPLFTYEPPEFGNEGEMQYYIQKLTQGAIDKEGADFDIRLLKGLIVAKKYPLMVKRLQTKLEEKFKDALLHVKNESVHSELAKTLVILREYAKKKEEIRKLHQKPPLKKPSLQIQVDEYQDLERNKSFGQSNATKMDLFGSLVEGNPITQRQENDTAQLSFNSGCLDESQEVTKNPSNDLLVKQNESLKKYNHRD